MKSKNCLLSLFGDIEQVECHILAPPLSWSLLEAVALSWGSPLAMLKTFRRQSCEEPLKMLLAVPKTLVWCSQHCHCPFRTSGRGLDFLVRSGVYWGYALSIHTDHVIPIGGLGLRIFVLASSLPSVWSSAVVFVPRGNQDS